MRLRMLKVVAALVILAVSLSPVGALQQDPGPGPGGGGGPCQISNCLTTCFPRIECCCWYSCPSGGTWVCKRGYCPETSRSCM